MNRNLVLVGILLTALGAPGAESPHASVVIRSQPLQAGRIDPKLFGNFVELLDDVVPGMWAEMLNDRSFEGVIPAANWCYYDGSLDICDRQWDTNASWSLDHEKPFNGSQCARLNASGGTARLTQSGLLVKRHMGYTFSGYLRSDHGIKARVLLKTLLPTGEWLTLASARLPKLSDDWQKYSLQMTSNGETDRAVFELRAEGQGHLWADKLSLMPMDNQAGWRQDVVAAIRQVQPAILRWGGSTVDPGHYRWKNGIGARDLRTPWRNENWGRIDPNDVGIDEFCQFCELVQAEPLICVSFADGAQSAADLVEYCNGDTATTWGAKHAANGHHSPYRVKYWQVGNEINGNDPEYLRQMPEFITRMKQADSKILLMSSFPTPALLERVGKDLAYVCPHHYTPDLAWCDRQFTEIGHLLEVTPGCAAIKMAVTEWNIDAGSWGLGRGKQATLEAALMNARYLQLLLRHADKVKIACRSNLANSYCGAIIETGPGGAGVLKRASYYVMQLYSRHAKPVPLQIEQSGEPVDLFACAAEDNSSAVLFAVNPRPQPIDCSLAFEGFSARSVRAEAVCDTLNAGQPDIINHWQAPERIRILPVPVAVDRITLRPFSATAVEFGSRTEH
jgi:alpha-L-arabinofuranosidase